MTWADILTLPLIACFVLSLLMSGWKSLGLCVLVLLALAIGGFAYLRLNTPATVLGAGLHSLYVLFAIGALLAGGLMKAVLLVLFRRRTPR